MRIKILVALASLIINSGSLSAATIWFHGGTDNSGDYSITPDSSNAISWMDGWASDKNPTTSFYGNTIMQVNRPSSSGTEQGFMILGFPGTGLTSSQVLSATLHLTQEYSAASQTWNIVGISSADSGWDNASMTWNTDGVDGWSSGTLGDSVINNYGSFNTDSNSGDNKIAIDITSAFEAYLDGTISGIAFMSLTPAASMFVPATANRFVAYTNEVSTTSNRPGLEVNVVPEASTALFGMLGALALLRRRRV